VQQNSLPRGKHLFFKFLNRSRTGQSVTVAVLTRDPDAQPGVQMTNVSKTVAQVLDARWNRESDAAVFQVTQHILNRDTTGPWIAGSLGRKLYEDAAAFTWEWI
jgi:hypothetical protein